MSRERSIPVAATADGGAGRAAVSANAPATATASVLVHDLLTGPVRPATVVAAGPSATYIAVDDGLVAVVASGGVRLPNAAVLAPGVALPSGPELLVGDGTFGDGDRGVVGVNRWFDPRVRLAVVDPAAVERLVGCLVDQSGADPLLDADSSGRLAVALVLGGIDSVVEDLVGRGTGLTPAGDDLLAGTLAALRAWQSPAADDLAVAVRGAAPSRTTRLSAALLEAADQAAVIPQAEAVMRALATAPEAVEAAAGDLLRVGHTSGWHLAAGLAVGAAHALAAAGGAVAA